MALQKLKNNFKLLSTGEKISTCSTLVSFLGVTVAFISWIYPKPDTSSLELSQANTEVSVPETPSIIDSQSRSSIGNLVTPVEAIQIIEGYSTDSARLNYLSSVKEDFSANFDCSNILALLDEMETDATKLHAIRLVVGKADRIYPTDAKSIIEKFDSDFSKNAASGIIRSINEAYSTHP